MMFPIRFALAFWCVAEVLAFVLVADIIGFGDAVLVTILTSVLGFVLLKRQGKAALAKFRTGMRGRDETGGVLLDALAVAGALALLLPGFLSDLAGAALSIAPVRRRAADWIGARGWRVSGWSAQLPRRPAGDMMGSDRADGDRIKGNRGAGDGVIDLEPAEWRRTESPRRTGR